MDDPGATNKGWAFPDDIFGKFKIALTLIALDHLP